MTDKQGVGLVAAFVHKFGTGCIRFEFHIAAEAADDLERPPCAPRHKYRRFPSRCTPLSQE